MRLFDTMGERFSQIIFFFTLALAGWLTPLEVYYEQPLLAAVFLLVFSTTITCTVRALKGNVAARNPQGALSIASSIAGLLALSACSSSFVCGAAGVGLIALFMPAFLGDFLAVHGVRVVELSILLQLFSLYWMGVFRASKKKRERR